jgi:hypothetical protein
LISESLLLLPHCQFRHVVAVADSGSLLRVGIYSLVCTSEQIHRPSATPGLTLAANHNSVVILTLPAFKLTKRGSQPIAMHNMQARGACRDIPAAPSNQPKQPNTCLQTRRPLKKR